MKKRLGLTFILISILVVAASLPFYVGNREARADWLICTPIDEPTGTGYNLTVYDEYDGYIYSVMGWTDCTDVGTAQYTYSARYDTDAGTWTALGGLLGNGTSGDSTATMTFNRDNGNPIVYMGTRNQGQWQQYTGAAWAYINGDVGDHDDGQIVHDVTNDEYKAYNDSIPSTEYTHADTTAGAWGGLQVAPGGGRLADNNFMEVCVGVNHYFFPYDADTFGYYEKYNETAQTLVQTNWGAAWDYARWAVWYDSSDATIYGVWSPTGEAMIPENCHLCTFNTTTSIWTEGANLGLATYSGLPDTFSVFQKPWGWFVDGYVYMVGSQLPSSGGCATTGSYFFKFPIAGYFDMSISNSPSTLTFNNVEESSTYYAYGSLPSNPIDDEECTFTLTNSSGCPADIYIKSTEYGGGNGWTLTTGSPGEDQLRLTAYASGDNPSVDGKVVTAVDQLWLSELADSATLKWDFKVELGTTTDTFSKSGYITLTAVEPIG